MRNREIVGRVRKVVAPDNGVRPDFMKSDDEALPLSCFHNVGYDIQQEPVVVIVLCTRSTGVGMVVPDGLEAG